MEFPVVTYKCTCGSCGKRFTIETSCGPSRLCNDCALTLLEIIWGCPLEISFHGIVQERKPVRRE